MAIGGALVGVAGFALPGQQRRGRVVVQRGMVGAGLAQFEQTEANFSLVASRLSFEEENNEVVAGRVLWVDASAGLTMTSTEVTGYTVLEVPPEQGQAREILGTARVNGEGAVPFSLVVLDTGTPGSGLDTLTLTVGDGARTSDSTAPVTGLGFRYAAAGPITIGDVQLIEFNLDTRAKDRSRSRRHRRR